MIGKYEFCAYLASIYFRECRLKENLHLFDFMGSTKIREICVKIYTRKDYI